MNRHVIRLLSAVLAMGCGALYAADDGKEHLVRLLYTTAGNPADYVVSPPSTYDGVAKLLLTTPGGTFLCSGGLLGGGQAVLTAAHCLTDSSGNLTTTAATATFNLQGGSVTINASAFDVHPGWNGDAFHGNDVAVVHLSATAPADADRYGLYTGTSELLAVANKAGYGRSGTGNAGDVINAGTLRSGQNRYDAFADLFNGHFGISGIPLASQLAYDFDNGLTANDGFGVLGTRLGVGSTLADLGLGSAEVMSAPGDSGGPSFIGGLLAGITSYGMTIKPRLGSSPDISPLSLNSSFGEFGVDTRVSAYAAWINEVAPIPEPENVALFLAGLGLIGWRLRRRQCRD